MSWLRRFAALLCNSVRCDTMTEFLGYYLLLLVAVLDGLFFGLFVRERGSSGFPLHALLLEESYWYVFASAGAVVLLSTVLLICGRTRWRYPLLILLTMPMLIDGLQRLASGSN
jgi:hypothetical protein